MLHDLGWLRQVKLEDSAGDVINPATVEKLQELKVLLQAIDANTDTLEAKVQSVRDQLDVLLSSRATEDTLSNVDINTGEILDTIGQESGATVLIKLQSLINKNQAQETSGNLADIKTNTDSLITQTGEVQPSPTINTVLGRLKDLWDLLTTLFTTGLAKVKIWDGERSSIYR